MGKSPLNKYKKFYNNSYVQNKRGGGLTPRPPPPPSGFANEYDVLCGFEDNKIVTIFRIKAYIHYVLPVYNNAKILLIKFVTSVLVNKTPKYPLTNMPMNTYHNSLSYFY